MERITPDFCYPSISPSALVIFKRTDRLSKSTFIRSLQCQKSLYLYKRHRELRDRISPEQLAIFSQGHSVGNLAQKLFPGGKDAGWKSPRRIRRYLQLTEKLVSENFPVIYEACFLAEDVLVAMDILVKKDDGWHAYEVKGTLDVRETFIRDAALQLHVIEKAGVPVKSVSIVHLNRLYRRHGALDLKSLFTITDITEQARKLEPFISSGINRAKNTLAGRSVPNVSIGPHCELPYTCDFHGHCRKHLPHGNIFDLAELEEERKWLLYQKGLTRIGDIPHDFPLTKKQKIEIAAKQLGTVNADAVAIATITSKLKYPAVFAELLFTRPAIPLINGTSPFGILPVGFSLTAIAEEGSAGITNTFIPEPGGNLVEKFVKRFLDTVSNAACVAVYDRRYELRFIREYCEANRLDATILNKVIDLAEPIQRKDFYHPGFNGKSTPSEILSSLGKPVAQTQLKSDYMAGIAFRQLFSENDIFRLSEIQTMLQQYLETGSRSIAGLYAILHAEALAKA